MWPVGMVHTVSTAVCVLFTSHKKAMQAPPEKAKNVKSRMFSA